VAANNSLTAISGITVGHFTDLAAMTGCTVVVLPEPSVVGGEIRGAAPATREYGLLAPGMTVEQAHAIVLTGGSAFGLASADGVMRELEAQGRGYKTASATVPIVPTAALYDLGVGDASVRPTAADGAAAFRSASSAEVAHGMVGAGTGATCGKWRGEKIPAGLGSAAVQVGPVTVAALVAVNALGDVFTAQGESLTGGPHLPGPAAEPPAANENTTLAIVATDAGLSRSELGRLMVRAHDAFGACLRPAHTGSDGDVCFAVATGSISEPKATAVHNLAEAAFEAIASAIANAVLDEPGVVPVTFTGD